MSFTYTQKIMFKHCDPAGIVFYPRYFEMINDTVEVFFSACLQTPFEALHRTGAVPTVQINTTFTAPSRHGDTLSITLTVTRLGTSSLGLTLIATAGDETRFTTHSTLVHTGPNGRATPWPAPLRNALTTELEPTP